MKKVEQKSWDDIFYDIDDFCYVTGGQHIPENMIKRFKDSLKELGYRKVREGRINIEIFPTGEALNLLEIDGEKSYRPFKNGDTILIEEE